MARTTTEPTLEELHQQAADALAEEQAAHDRRVEADARYKAARDAAHRSQKAHLR